MKEIVVLGAGTAGTMIANRLARSLDPRAWRITLLDRDDQHLYQPGLLFVPFGLYRPDEVVRPRRAFVGSRVRCILDGVRRIDTAKQRVVTRLGSDLSYDILVIATGSRILPEQTAGLTETGWRTSAHDFYSLDGASVLAKRLAQFKQGRIVLNIAEMPIKCPVAPLEFMFLADSFFRERGLREAVELVFATPLDGAFTKPRASTLLGGLLEEKGISVVPEFAVESVAGDKQQLTSYDGRTIDYDLLVSIPVHAGAAIIAESGLGDAMGWVPTHKHTLQSTEHPNVFALGDATNLPSSKAGSVAHFQAEVLAANILNYIDDAPLEESFDGHSNCFIETGNGKAMLIDFNYETEPLPGRFPLPGIGPFTLLEESYANHWGKLAFKWIYWNKLLPGEDLPLDHRMLLAGKYQDSSAPAPTTERFAHHG